MNRRTSILSLATLAVALFVASPALAQGNSPRSIPGEVIVRWKRDAGPSERASLRAQMNAQRVREFKFIEAEHLRLPPGQSAADVIQRFRNNPRIEYIEPNYEITADLVPNDQRFPELYAMRNTGQTGGTAGADIKAVNAWDLFTGDPNLKIGVIDTGVDTNHVDLVANVWTNPGEIPGNLIDDDNNGYVDDVHGYDFVNNDGGPFDDNGHGTHCAGTIAGVGNNSIGVVGVNWQAKIVGIKFLSASGSGSTAGAISGIQYAITVGVRLTSNSWGGGGFSQALLDAINAAGAAGQLFIAAAGNSSQNTDVTPHYPSSYNSPYIVAVAATDHNDNLASFSNFGATSVDLAAPGVSILSCQPGGGYQLLSGTSMATPHVSGVVALAMGRFPSASNLQIKQLLLSAVDVKAQLAGKCLTGGRLNAFMTIAEPDTIPPGAISDLATVNPASNSIGLTWTATGDDGGTGRASSYEIRYSTSPITDEASFLAATLVAGGPDPQPAGSAESFEVGGLGFSTLYYFALRARDEFGSPGPVSNVAAGTTLGIPNLSATPTSFSANLLSGGQSNQTLTLGNTAAGTLDFTIPTPELQFSQPAPYEYVPVGKGQEDVRVGNPVTQGAGGPDGFGYRWIDSNEPGGPAFSWVDITGVGTQLPLTGDDSWSGPLAMGMDFPFYDNAFNSLRVHTNGFLSFTASTGDFYDNQPLPTSGGAANLVAPMWDDMDFGATPRVYTHFDGTRFIVSWIGVPHYQTGGPYSFQAILYPTGEIVYQYLSLGAITNSATVGIQNGAQNVGLTVAFNTNYLQNNLAVRIVPLRQWLSVTPTSGRILAGQSQDVQVRMDATGLDGGDFAGTIHILSNDPDGSPADLSATLHVTGAPDIAASPGSLAFGQVFVGAHPTRTLTVSNPGTDALNVNVVSSDPTLATDVASFSLVPHAARNLIVTYSPTVPALLNATLTLQSNDPDTPNLAVPVTGEGVPAPAFSVSPEQFDVTLLTNTATSQNLRVSNTGGSNYVFTAEAEVITPSGTVVVKGDADNVDLEKGAPDVQFGPAPLRAGGPDVFGYTYQDSDEPGGPVFSWVDISATGTAIPFNADDQNLGPFPVGFSFPYYGATVSQFRLCTNGWLTFTPTNTQTTFTNTSLPNSGTTVPPNLLAAFWDDLDYRPVPAPNARAYYQYDGTKLVIQFKAVPRRLESGTTATNDFEIILFPNGTIVYQYLTMNAVLKNSATIGTQNAARNDGLQVVFNANYVKNNLAIRFRPPARFLTVTPAGGTVAPGSFLDLTVGFNAAGLFGGLYNGQVHIVGNDPVLPQKDIPANLTVIGVPDVAVAPASIDFGTTYIGFAQLRQLTVSNVGTDALNVSDITFDDPAFGVDQTSFSVPPLGSAVLFVAFNPAAVGPRSATMTIASNDPDTPAKTVPVSGLGLIAPDVRPDPASIAATIDIPGSETHTLTLHNDGGSDLNFVVGTQITAVSVPIHDELALGKEESDPRPGILGSGGPDVFGYTWRDSDEPGGPAFDWVDITGIGTPVTFTSGDDANTQSIPIGFSFPFYGATFNNVNICSNGWISFTSTLTAFTNQPLPNSGSGVPENLLAAYWDDLNPGTATPRVYRYSDGTRFIVSYVGVPRLTSGGPYTFQIVLYSSGRIVYQYLDMQGTRLNEATVGIQNAARNDGLTVVYNNNYVHDNLAIEIATVPEYLTVSPTSGSVPAGGSAALDVQFNTTGLFGGLHNGSIRVSSNDPDEPLVTVPTQLTAIGVPDIAAVPPGLDFGPVYVGLSGDLTVQVRNLGSDALTVTGGALSNPVHSLVGATFPFTLGKNGSRTLTVRFAPSAACSPCAGSLDLASNDPDTPTLSVALTGVGVIPPEIGTTPASLRAALATTLGPTAFQTTKTLVIENTGGSDLNWTAQALSALPMAITTESAEHGKNDPGAPGALGSGGPDAFGYRWADSDDPQGSPFSWIDITGIGTPLHLPGNGDDQNVPGIPIGFAFPFYGNAFNTVNVCTNGWLSFTSTQTTLTNVALPNASSSTPDNLLAAFWDDIDPDTLETKIWTWGDATKFIVSYVNVPRFSSGQLYTFQVILYPSGTIDYQYLSMQSGRLNEATIGIQNGTKDVGLNVVYNALYVHDNLRVRFSSLPGWLTVSPLSGVTPAGGRDTLLVGFDATGLADGDYDGQVRIASNDLDEPTLDVPCHLHVGVAAAAFDLDPNSLNRASGGLWVKGLVTPPSPSAPQDIVLSSVRVQRTVQVAPNSPVSYSGGVAEYKFDRTDLQAVLPIGEHVPVEVIGRVADVTWFSAWDTVRVMRPGLRASTYSTFTAGSGSSPDHVQAASSVSLHFDDPQGATASWFDLWYSENGGESWSLVEGGITARDYGWQAPQQPSQEAMLDLVAYDEQGAMGSFLTPVFEVMGGTTAVGDDVGPDRLALRFAGGNPARQAVLDVGVAQRGSVRLEVFDLRGAVVRTVADREFEAGWHRLQWDARDAAGRTVEPGLYFLRARMPRETAISRFVLVR